ncbi:hypothetical protein N182_18650 [Sinorhizobium sp. GL2]|nr:hypothetical protein N182_18650 [Sinorhizobium sp. GL2]
MIKTPSNAGLASAASVPAEAAKRVIEFDIRMSQFAGGAPMNGVDDDQPAIQAAIDYCKTLGGRYTGGTPFIRLPAGQIKTSQPLVVTGADNVELKGDGDGATRLLIGGNFAGISANDPVSQPLQRFGVQGLTIQGPGYTNAAAYGIRLGANNNCTIAARIWACRRALSLANSWQTNILNIRFDGQASLANYDGLYLEDGVSSVVENSVLVMGGLIQGCKRYGFRGESVTGSKVFGLEVLGCENTGVFIGESPSGKDLKWFSWIGGVIDTCTDLIVVKKGSSSLAYEIHFSGMWLGYAYEGLPGVGVGVEFNGMTDSSIQADMVVNMGHVFLLKGCTACSAEAKVIRDYDRLLQGSVAILLENTRDSYVHARTARKQTGSPATEVIKETGTSDYNIIGEGRLDGAVTLVGTHSKKSSAIIEG